MRLVAAGPLACEMIGLYPDGHDDENRVFPSPVSVVDERRALNQPVSLFEHAQRLHRLTPDGPLPDGGHPLPGDGDHPNIPYSERRLALVALLREFVSNPRLSPADLHERCTHLAVKPGDVSRALQELHLNLRGGLLIRPVG